MTFQAQRHSGIRRAMARLHTAEEYNLLGDAVGTLVMQFIIRRCKAGFAGADVPGNNVR